MCCTRSSVTRLNFKSVSGGDVDFAGHHAEIVRDVQTAHFFVDEREIVRHMMFNARDLRDPGG